MSHRTGSLLDVCAFTYGVLILRYGSPNGREAAACALNNISQERSVQIQLVEIGAVGPLVQLLRDGPAAGKEAAAWTLRTLATDSHNKEVLVDEGAVEALLSMMNDVLIHDSAKEAGARALWNIAYNNMPNKIYLAECGAVEILITMLRSQHPGSREAAAGALRNLVVTPEIKGKAVQVSPCSLETMRHGRQS